MTNQSILPVLLAVVMLTGCVTSRKYDSLAQSKDLLEREYNALLGVRDEKNEVEAARRNLMLALFSSSLMVNTSSSSLSALLL